MTVIYKYILPTLNHSESERPNRRKFGVCEAAVEILGYKRGGGRGRVSDAGINSYQKFLWP